MMTVHEGEAAQAPGASNTEQAFSPAPIASLNAAASGIASVLSMEPVFYVLYSFCDTLHWG